MVSIELLRRYPFFAGLSQENMAALARVVSSKYEDKGCHYQHCRLR
jgi:hypothetical protein